MTRPIANTPEVLRSTIVYRMLEPKDAEQYRAVRLECLKRFPKHFGSTYEFMQLFKERYLNHRLP